MNIEIATTENIRVRYLDKEDIESCGWYFEKQHPGMNDMTFSSSFGKEETLFLEYEDFDDKLPYNVRIWEGSNRQELNYFNGIIKNKSELIKVMKMLRIYE